MFSISMRAAVIALRHRNPTSIAVAVPVAPPSACQQLRPAVDQLVCLVEPRLFQAVGAWYEDFTPTSDDEVRALLREAPRAA